MDDPLDFTGRVVLVTGGTRNIGLGIATAFARRGADVVACGRSDPGDRLPAGVVFEGADVRDADAVAALVSAVVTRHGRLDVVVNNAGGSPFALAAEAKPRFHERIVALNLLAPLHVSQAAYRVMAAQADGGSIVMVGSVSGTRPSPGTAAYGAAKAGVTGLVRSLAVEWAPNVRVNEVVAGMIRTDDAHLHYGDDAGVARVAATVPMGRLGEPADVADACVFLASPMARYVTGASLALHGGGERPAFLAAVTPPAG